MTRIPLLAMQLEKFLHRCMKRHVRGYFNTKLFVMVRGLDAVRHPSLEYSTTLRSNKLVKHTMYIDL